MTSYGVSLQSQKEPANDKDTAWPISPSSERTGHSFALPDCTVNRKYCGPNHAPVSVDTPVWHHALAGTLAGLVRPRARGNDRAEGRHWRVNGDGRVVGATILPVHGAIGKSKAVAGPFR